MNTSLLSFYERIREFGLLRAPGWNRRRLFGLVLGEALLVSFVGAALVVGHRLRGGGRRHPRTEAAGCVPPDVSLRDLRPRCSRTCAMAVLGALYPAVQAARLAPLVALQHE